MPSDSDATLSISGPGGKPLAELAITAKAGRLTPKDALQLASCAPSGRGSQVIVASPYLSPRACDLLASEGFGYFDLTGNLRIELDKPVLFLHRRGETRDPSGTPRSLGSLRGPAAGRVVRGICDLAPPYGIRELGERIQVPAPTVSRVVELLEDEALLERKPKGPVLRADPAPIIRRWVEDYGLVSSNQTLGYIAPRGLDRLRERLIVWGEPYVVSASMAVPNEIRVAPARLAVVYVSSLSESLEALDLRAADAGTNVLVVESLGDMAFERPRIVDGLNCAALSQTAADLLTSPGRGPAEGEELLTWMEMNEDDWRL